MLADYKYFDTLLFMTIKDLPNNILELKKIIIENHNKLIKKILDKNKEISNKKKEILDKNKEIERLNEIIKTLRRKKYAPSSEKDRVFNEMEEIDSDYIDDSSDDDKITVTYKRKKGKRKVLPKTLPRKDIIIDISEEEKSGMKKIGEEVSEKLVIKPAEIYIERTIRPKYAPIDNSNDEKIKIKSLPPQLLPKTMATSSLISYIIVSKFMDALPLYRLENIFSRIGIEIPRQTMARWLIKVYLQLMPLYNLLQDQLLDSGHIQMDETRTQVLNEKNKKATSKSYMWVRFKPGDNPIILYDYAPTRKGQVPIELLNGFKGYLQVDGYDGYSSACVLYELIRMGCMDHCRRKFYDVYKSSKNKKNAKKALSYLKLLYDLEDKIKDLSVDEKYNQRQKHAKPVLNEMKEWLDDIKYKIAPKSPMGKAVNYALNEWNYLIVYLEDGKLNISNILIENKIRPFAIGRKNWLFSASVEGAKASAMFYSLIETAKANGLNVFEYFNTMLDQLPNAKTLEDYEKLLPLKSFFKIK